MLRNLKCLLFFFKVIPDLLNAVKCEDHNTLQRALRYIASCLKQAQEEFKQIHGKYCMPGNIQGWQSQVSDYLKCRVVKQIEKKKKKNSHLSGCVFTLSH